MSTIIEVPTCNAPIHKAAQSLGNKLKMLQVEDSLPITADKTAQFVVEEINASINEGKLPTQDAELAPTNDIPQTLASAIYLLNIEESPSEFIDTPDAIANLVDSLVDLPTNPRQPSLYIDLEGINLCRHGSISIVQLLIHPLDQTHLIDIHTLGSCAFTTAGKSGQTLQTILESADIIKAFFDVRNDSDALYSHFGVKLAGVHDIQLMELASRLGNLNRKKFLAGLGKCIDRDAGLTTAEQKVCKEVKEKGKKGFAPECGGSYEVFNARPMVEEMVLYCKQDVQLLPRLWQCYYERMKPHWAGKVEKATLERIALSQSISYNGKGPDMAFGPWV